MLSIGSINYFSSEKFAKMKAIIGERLQEEAVCMQLINSIPNSRFAIQAYAHFEALVDIFNGIKGSQPFALETLECAFIYLVR